MRDQRLLALTCAWLLAGCPYRDDLITLTGQAAGGSGSAGQTSEGEGQTTGGSGSAGQTSGGEGQPAPPSPILNYTDVASASASNFVCIFGRNLGDARGESRVYFDDIAQANEAASYVLWQPATRGTAAQEVCVTMPEGGTINGVSVVVNGIRSNTLPMRRHAGRTLHVAKSGDDANDCLSQSTACQTIARGAHTAEPGDTVIVQAGTYSDIDDPTTSIVELSANRGDLHGTAESPYTIRAYPGEDVILLNDGTAACDATLFVVIDHVQIIGFTSIGQRAAILAAHARIANNVFRDSNADGCNAAEDAVATGLTIRDSATDSIVIGNDMRDSNNNVAGNGVTLRGARHEIAYNRIENNSAYGITGFSDADMFPVNDNIIRNNHIASNGDVGVLVGSGERNFVINNVIVGNGIGVRVAHAPATDHSIQFNTVVDNVGACIELRNSKGDTVHNNICFGNGGDAIAVESSTDTLESHNLFGIDPEFVDAAALDFRLQPGSLARDAGMFFLSATDDFDGLVRPVGPSPDIGAFEYSPEAE